MTLGIPKPKALDFISAMIPMLELQLEGLSPKNEGESFTIILDLVATLNDSLLLRVMLEKGSHCDLNVMDCDRLFTFKQDGEMGGEGPRSHSSSAVGAIWKRG